MQDLSRRRRLACEVAAEQDGWRLDAVVLDWLSREFGSPLSKAAVRKLVMAGAVRIDGRSTRRAGAPLSTGARLEAHVDTNALFAARLSRPSTDKTTDSRAAALVVLYEDEDLIAVSKPPGLPVHATADAARDDLFSLVRRLLAARSGTPRPPHAEPYLGLHHRLDVDTSGVILFTKREAANAAIARQFAEGTVDKVYHALVAKPLDHRRRGWRVDNRLAPTGGGRRARMAEAETGGVRAATAFHVAESGRMALLVEAKPETGRKHQIRAHLAGVGLPILGDARYGGALRVGRCAIPRTMLHARRLALLHPITAARLLIVADYPEDFADAVACLLGRHPATISRR